MELKVERRWKKPLYTIGRLYVDGKLFCNTLEDTDRGLRQTDSTYAIKQRKVAGETAIPAGRYRVTLAVTSPKYVGRAQYAFCKGKLPRLINVPGFDGILIHIGNTRADTSGCILVGKNTQAGKVLESTVTFKSLYAKMKSAADKGEEIWIEIG